MCSPIKLAMDLEHASSDEEVDSVELPELLQNILVSIEHVIQRVPLDELVFPCPECLEYLPFENQESLECAACSCSCGVTLEAPVNVKKRDMGMQTSPMFEFASSIPHIDSDEEEDKEHLQNGK